MCGFSYIFHLNDPKNTAFQFATPYASAKEWESAMDCEEVKLLLSKLKEDSSAGEKHRQWAACWMLAVPWLLAGCFKMLVVE